MNSISHDTCIFIKSATIHFLPKKIIFSLHLTFFLQWMLRMEKVLYCNLLLLTPSMVQFLPWFHIIISYFKLCMLPAIFSLISFFLEFCLISTWIIYVTICNLFHFFFSFFGICFCLVVCLRTHVDHTLSYAYIQIWFN